ncbi:unnamed protein product [Orchesella dallaii]|uniref:Uncharacterized protein n=1 Tax=Orchesella dallaii TaxID=48710 RepID=A0ABP1RZM9_9HEXA
MGRHKRRKNKRGHDESIAWPSQIFKDESLQVSSHLLRNFDRSKKETGPTGGQPRNLNKLTQNLNMAVTAKTKRSQSYFQTAMEVSPEDIRSQYNTLFQLLFGVRIDRPLSHNVSFAPNSQYCDNMVRPYVFGGPTRSPHNQNREKSHGTI